MMIAMRNFGAALFALTTCLAVNAAYIVNTGSNPNGTGWTFASFQYSAGEFAVGSAQTINSVEGFYQTFIPTPGNVTISLHSDGGNIPGATLFSQSHSLAWP